MQLEARAKIIDERVAAALRLEKSGDTDEAVLALTEAISDVRAFTTSDPYASAHRRLHAPADRLSLLLERRKAYPDALSVIHEWQTTFDPVQPGKSIVDSLNKRADRLRAKLE